jgi:hypothetical protein
VQDTGGYGLFFKPFQGSVDGGDLVSVSFYQDNPATPNTKFTLSGYAGGEANFCAFFSTNSPVPRALFVVIFLNSSGTVLASNAFDLVGANLPSTGPGSMALFTTPEYTAPAGTVTVRAGAYMLNAYSTTGAQGFFVDAFSLDSVAPPGSPEITTQPAHLSVSAGTNATFSVVVANPTGVSYQWQRYNTNLSNGGNITGANTANLTVSGVSAADVGHYRVLVSNSAGSVYSSDATLTITGLNFFPVISITGKVGDTYRIDYSTQASPTTWLPLSTNKLITSPQRFIDTTSPGDNSKFYRAVYLR